MNQQPQQAVRPSAYPTCGASALGDVEKDGVPVGACERAIQSNRAINELDELVAGLESRLSPVLESKVTNIAETVGTAVPPPTTGTELGDMIDANTRAVRRLHERVSDLMQRLRV